VATPNNQRCSVDQQQGDVSVACLPNVLPGGSGYGSYGGLPSEQGLTQQNMGRAAGGH